MRQEDPYQVAAKCQEAAEAFEALEEWLRLPDASQVEIQAAVLDFRQAQELAAQVRACRAVVCCQPSIATRCPQLAQTLLF